MLAGLLPGVRLVLMVRHPVHRVWSAARRILGLLGGRDLARVTPAELEAVLADPRLHARSDYPAMLDRWGRHFPAEQLHVEVTEDVGRDPRAVLRRIFRHLGVDEDPGWERLRPEEGVNRNPARDIPAELEARLRERYRGVVAEMRRRLPVRTACWDDV
ncbi:MAG: sulfotransferase [Myxococcales bacterium]|nr:sulfotransferase [Myxococcales bacterium]